MQNTLTAKKISGIWTFILCVGLTLGIGTLSGWLSGAMKGYEGINMPSFALPDWSYGIIWTALYILMGVSLYLLITQQPLSRYEQGLKVAAIVLWGLQFAMNILWPFMFFNIDFTVAFVINVVMTALVTSLVTIGFFIKPLSSALLLPYWAWLLFASYQTLMVIVLNA